MNKLSLNDTVNVGRNKFVKVSELVDDKKEIFRLIKNGTAFDDEVLQKCGIKKTIRNEHFVHVFVEHEKADKKELPKEKDSLKMILRSIHTINSEENEVNDNDETDYNVLTDIEDE